MPSPYEVREYETAAVLAGRPSAALVDASFSEDAGPTGAVWAECRDGVWYPIAPSDRTADAVSVYVL